MSVQFSWPADEIHQYSAIDPTSSQQSFIWAVGPDQQIASSSVDAPISQHKSYGKSTIHCRGLSLTKCRQSRRQHDRYRDRELQHQSDQYLARKTHTGHGWCAASKKSGRDSCNSAWRQFCHSVSPRNDGPALRMGTRFQSTLDHAVYRNRRFVHWILYCNRHERAKSTILVIRHSSSDNRHHSHLLSPATSILRLAASRHFQGHSKQDDDILRSHNVWPSPHLHRNGQRCLVRLITALETMNKLTTTTEVLCSTIPQPALS